VELKGVRFTYPGGERPALAGVDLAVAPGELLAILGPSAAGKSTLCLTLNGLIPHFVKGSFEGQVLIHGLSTADRAVSRLARDVGLVFQDFEAQLFSTNVELEVAFGPENFAVPVEEIRRRVTRALTTVGLRGLERRDPATFSGGQKQRLAIASVLALEPNVIAMDEPTSDLDPLGKRSIFDVASRLRREGVTLVIVEHETEEVVDADRVVVLASGHIAAVGPPDEVLTRVGWLDSLGVQPPGAAHLMIGLGERPALTVEAASDRLKTRRYHVPDERWDALLARDAARTEAYGAPIIEVNGLVHRYPGGVNTLGGVDLEVRRGEFVAVIGQNGSGKTTLVKHINGLLRPVAGEVRVAGRTTSGQSVIQLGRHVGYVFQNPDHQIFADQLFAEVAFGPRNHGVGESEVRERVDEALAAVGLSGREEEDPFALTKGERQRVAVASVLATRPDVIILDEPTTGLDYREQRHMMDLVRRLNESRRTIICVTHSMWVVAEYAHRVVVMKDGQILADGPTRTVLPREADLRSASLRAPQIVRITAQLGRALLTVEEALALLERR
jgi:energy-coupling factor transport system ATP-binding protein